MIDQLSRNKLTMTESKIGTTALPVNEAFFQPSKFSIFQIFTYRINSFSARKQIRILSRCKSTSFNLASTATRCSFTHGDELNVIVTVVDSFVSLISRNSKIDGDTVFLMVIFNYDHFSIVDKTADNYLMKTP